MATDNQKRTGRALQQLATEELGKKPSYMTCLHIVEKHLKDAEAAGFYRRQEVAAFLFENHREHLLTSAERKEANA